MGDDFNPDRRKWWSPGFLTFGNLRDLLIVATLALLWWKLFNMQVLSFDFKDFCFSDLLSLILALFAITLSAAFYFKATSTSNQFYDNVYKFTRDVSEILGRIEAGFGERLRHLDEGYTGLRDKFEKLPADTAKIEKQEEAKKREVEEKEREYHVLISNLMERANYAESEREGLMKRLADAQAQIDTSKEELRKLQGRIYESEAEAHTGWDSFFGELRHYLRKLSPAMDASMSPALLNHLFCKNVRDRLPGRILAGMTDSKCFNEDGTLSEMGVKFIREALRTRPNRL